MNKDKAREIILAFEKKESSDIEKTYNLYLEGYCKEIANWQGWMFDIAPDTPAKLSLPAFTMGRFHGAKKDPVLSLSEFTHSLAKMLDPEEDPNSCFPHLVLRKNYTIYEDPSVLKKALQNGLKGLVDTYNQMAANPDQPGRIQNQKLILEAIQEHKDRLAFLEKEPTSPDASSGSDKDIAGISCFFHNKIIIIDNENPGSQDKEPSHGRGLRRVSIYLNQHGWYFPEPDKILSIGEKLIEKDLRLTVKTDKENRATGYILTGWAWNPQDKEFHNKVLKVVDQAIGLEHLEVQIFPSCNVPAPSDPGRITCDHA